eukprot:2260496-Prymnesium_polylepis.1
MAIRPAAPDTMRRKSPPCDNPSPKQARAVSEHGRAGAGRDTNTNARPAPAPRSAHNEITSSARSPTASNLPIVWLG